MKKTILFAFLSVMLVTAAFFAIHTDVKAAGEDTLELCTDSIDNNDNFLADISDPECAPFYSSGPVPVVPAVVVIEDTLALCTDSIDNDENFLTDASDPTCAPFYPSGPVPVAPLPPVVEDTFALCTDSIDNDENFLVDNSDPGCAPFYPSGPIPVPPTPPVVPTEDTLALCTDSIDNDEDFLIDSSDSDCAAFVATTTPPAPVVEDEDSGSSSRRSTRSTGTVLGTSTAPLITTGEVLGAMSCTPYISAYLKVNSVNSVEEVKKLQTFLNEFIDAKLPVTGFFGPLTFQAVKNLQFKYSDQILRPWIDQGVVKSLAPTGYVFKTTQWFINSQKCGGEALPMPILK